MKKLEIEVENPNRGLIPLTKETRTHFRQAKKSVNKLLQHKWDWPKE